MKFCSECGSVCVIDTQNRCYVCTECGNSEPLQEQTTVAREKKETDKVVVVGEDEQRDLSALPKVNIECPKCGHNEAYTREQSVGMGVGTLIQSFRCVKCGHTWRSG